MENDKIKKIAKRAGFVFWKEDEIDWSSDYTVELEKFAELIVKECSNFLKDRLDDHFAAEQLEEHFGVEE